MLDKVSSGRGEWSSRWAFILATTGSAVGLGNIWKFPYITGENGGGAFVLVYLACVLCIGIPIMVAEILFGRRGHQNPILTMRSLAKQEGRSPLWSVMGILGVTAGFLILSYYSVFGGETIAYIFRAFSGDFTGQSHQQITAFYQSLSSNSMTLLGWHSLFMGICIVTVGLGVNKGLEKSTRLLMPSLFVLLVVMVIYALVTTGDAFEQGVHFLFDADFSKLTANSILIAMGHSFFTLSLGMGAVMVYGSYLSKTTSIFKVSLAICAIDTLVALLAGIAIFPIVFANGLDADAGPGLIFKTLPIAFGQMAGGQIFGGLFFVLLLAAAWTSAISILEPITSWLVENKGISRFKASIGAGGIIWLLGLLTVISFNPNIDFTLFGMTPFDFLDYLTTNIMLPLGGLLIALFAGWMMKRENTEQELSTHPYIYTIWRFLIRYASPAAIIIVFANLIGIL